MTDEGQKRREAQAEKARKKAVQTGNAKDYKRWWKQRTE